jgi:mannose-6-phosphate isomerase-like protein (cupin superfamily)
MASSQTQPHREPIVVSRDTGRTSEPLNIYGDILYLKLTGKDTQGKYTFIEDITAPNQGPPLHVHHREDEGFYILDGDYVFEVDGRRIAAHTGDFLWVPRDVPHCFQNIGSTPGRILLTLEPAGIEDFFAELATVPGPPDSAKVAPLFFKHGLELLGPPLSAR